MKAIAIFEVELELAPQTPKINIFILFESFLIEQSQKIYKTSKNLKECKLLTNFDYFDIGFTFYNLCNSEKHCIQSHHISLRSFFK